MTSSRRRQMAVRVSPGRPRTPPPVRVIVVGLAGLLLVLVVGVFLFGAGGPVASPSATAGTSGTPSLPAPSATASSPASPTATAAGSQTSAPPSAVVSTTPPASGLPLGAAVARDATFSLLGLDDQVAPEALPRLITFYIDGRADIRVDLSDVSSGSVRMCLWPGDASTTPADSDCVITGKGNLTRTPAVAGPWTVSLIGAEPGQSPSATVRLRFAASAAMLQLADFRFQGADSPNYTGFRVRVLASGVGQLALNATWDDGQGGDYPYLISLTDLDGSGEPPIFTGESDQAQAMRDVIADHHYEAAIDDTQATALEQVLLQATVSWP
jgi:hypothetical protein